MQNAKVLFICSKSPYPPREGGSIATYNLIKGLMDKGVKVKVLCISTPKMPVQLKDIPDSFREQTGFDFFHINTMPGVVGALKNLFTSQSYHLTRFFHHGFASLIENTLKQEQFDVIQFESLFVAPYLNTVRKFSKVPILLRAHNVEHVIWERIASQDKNVFRKMYLRLQASRLKSFEIEAFNRFDGLAAITPEDAAYMKDNACRKPVSVIPFGIDTTNLSLTRTEIEIPSVFFIGSLNWLPNTDGLRWFINEVWPALHRQFPNLIFYVAGRHCPDWLKDLKVPQVIVTGEVEDAVAFMASKSIMVVPLFSGSGMRVKIIEGMYAGNCIISTTLGAEGISYTKGKHLHIADNAAEFINILAQCINNPVACAETGRHASQLVKQSYSSHVIIPKLIGFYNELINR